MAITDKLIASVECKSTNISVVVVQNEQIIECFTDKFWTVISFLQEVQIECVKSKKSELVFKYIGGNKIVANIVKELFLGHFKCKFSDFEILNKMDFKTAKKLFDIKISNKNEITALTAITENIIK